MASFYEKYLMSIPSIFWCKYDISSKETTQNEGSAASNPSPRFPLDVGFEKDTGVTMGLGLVPHLARLCQEGPNERRIVFGINKAVDHFSRSLIQTSVANTYELISLIPSPPVSCPSPVPSSLFSPISHTALIGSQPDMDLPDHDMPLDPEYFLFLRDENHEEDDISIDSDVFIPIGSESQDDIILSEKCGEHIYDSFFDGVKAQKISHLAVQEEDYTQVISCGASLKTTHINDDSHNIMEHPRESCVGGLSAIFGVRANRYKYSCCGKKCKKVEADVEKDMGKSQTKGTQTGSS